MVKTKIENYGEISFIKADREIDNFSVRLFMDELSYGFNISFPSLKRGYE